MYKMYCKDEDWQDVYKDEQESIRRKKEWDEEERHYDKHPLRRGKEKIEDGLVKVLERLG